jgi:hypothetical protein
MRSLNPKSPHELEEEDEVRMFLMGEEDQPRPQQHLH